MKKKKRFDVKVAPDMMLNFPPYFLPAPLLTAPPNWDLRGTFLLYTNLQGSISPSFS